MIADNREGPIEAFPKLVTAPVWAPIYFGYLSCRRVAEGLSKGKTKPKRADLNPAWMASDGNRAGRLRGPHPRWRACQQPPFGRVDGLLPGRGIKAHGSA